MGFTQPAPHQHRRVVFVDIRFTQNCSTVTFIGFFFFFNDQWQNKRTKITRKEAEAETLTLSQYIMTSKTKLLYTWARFHPDLGTAYKCPGPPPEGTRAGDTAFPAIRGWQRCSAIRLPVLASWPHPTFRGWGPHPWHRLETS